MLTNPELHSLAIQQIKAFTGQLRGYHADRFAIRQGLLIMKYSGLNDTIQLTDGEVYSMRQVIREESEHYVKESIERMAKKCTTAPPKNE